MAVYVTVAPGQMVVFPVIGLTSGILLMLRLVEVAADVPQEFAAVTEITSGISAVKLNDNPVPVFPLELADQL